MSKKIITCTTCPVGCDMTVEAVGDKIEKVTGNLCKRGEAYAHDEFFLPKRILATSIKVEGGQRPLVSVRSNQPLAKDKIFECMNIIRDFSVKAPVHSGDVLISDIDGQQVDIIATSSVDQLS